MIKQRKRTYHKLTRALIVASLGIANLAMFQGSQAIALTGNELMKVCKDEGAQVPLGGAPLGLLPCLQRGDACLLLFHHGPQDWNELVRSQTVNTAVLVLDETAEILTG